MNMRRNVTLRSLRRPLSWFWIVCACVPGTWAQSSPPTPTWSIDAESSLVAVVTHKEGLASGLAHEHLVAAPLEAMDLRFDPSKVEGAEVTLVFEVDALSVDDADLQKRWQQSLLDADVLGAPFAELSPKDRRKIRQSMLGPKQLDAVAHPKIRIVANDLRADGVEATARLVLEVRGQSVQRVLRFPWPLVSAGELRVDFIERFGFSEFGIRPYSALLGAIRVADEFDVVVRLVGRSGGTVR